MWDDEMGKLTDKEKKLIIADYVELGNYSQVAKKHNTTDTTVRRIVSQDKDTLKRVEQKKEDNIEDVLSYLDSLSELKKEIFLLSLEAVRDKLKNPDMFTNVKDIITVFGILTDKELKILELRKTADSDTIAKLDALLEAQKDA